VNNLTLIDRAEPLRRMGPRLRGDDDSRVGNPSI